MDNTQKAINSVVEYRDLPHLKKGQRCEVNGKPGKIWGGNHAANLNVLFDGDKRLANCHPNYKMRIFNDSGEIVYASDDV